MLKTTLPLPLTLGFLFLLAAARPQPTFAQTPDTPPLLNPVEDYGGVGDPSQGGLELQQFRSSEFDAGNVAWLMIGSLSGLFLITPGLLLFYCGLLKTRSATTVMVRYVGLAALLSMTWVLWTYSLAFARNVSSHDVLDSERTASTQQATTWDRLVGGPDHFGLRGLDSQLGDAAPLYPLRRRFDSVPHLLFMTCQMMFFISVPVPLVVAFSGRLTAAGMACFVVAWGTVVYAPITYWVWGGGWHAAVLDSGGSIPAHISVGFSVLAALWMLGPQQSRAEGTGLTKHFVYLGLGVMLFWGGSLIWNASRWLAADGYAVNAFATTHLAACAGLIGWAGSEWLARGKASLTGFCAGPFVGLVAIASGAGYVAPQSSIVIGLLSGTIACRVYWMIEVRCEGNPLLVVFSMQAIPGVLGTLLTGIFATASVAGFDQQGNTIAGLLVGDPGRLGDQAWAAACAAIFATVGTVALLLVIRLARGIRPINQPARVTEDAGA